MTAALSNWAGNHVYAAARHHAPRSVDELRAIVARAKRARAVGSRHSFNDVADAGPDGDLVSLEHFDRVLDVDATPGRPTVTLEAGVIYGQLCRALADTGLALHNMASLPHISVVGACATATHGSGDRNRNLATAVAALDVVTAGGELRTFSREADGQTFAGMVVSLGGLGIVSRLTLDLIPAFDVEQRVLLDLPTDAVLAHFDRVTSAAYSVSLFSDWRGPRINQVWLKRRATDDDAADVIETLGATPAAADIHPIAGCPADTCTPQMGVRGPWHERLTHFRMGFTPSAGEELQSEYFVPRHHAVAALRAIDAMRDAIAPFVQISEVRTIAADELWMSPCYRQACVGIHFTWRKDWPTVSALLPRIEAALAPFSPRPHWGKLFTMPPAQLRSRYDRLPDFRQLLQEHDPQGTFRNPFLERYVFGA